MSDALGGEGGAVCVHWSQVLPHFVAVRADPFPFLASPVGQEEGQVCLAPETTGSLLLVSREQLAELNKGEGLLEKTLTCRLRT